MTNLFKRQVLVQLVELDDNGEISIEFELTNKLKTTFLVNADLKNNPNSAEISIYNQSQDNIDRINSLNKPNVVLHAGYGEELIWEKVSKSDIVFSGQPNLITNDYISNNIVTKIYCGDGIDAYKYQIRKGFAETSIHDMIKDIKNEINTDSTLKKIFVFLENGFDELADIADSSEKDATSTMKKIANLQKGISINDTMMNFLDKMAKSYKKQISIQNGSLTVMGNNQYSNEPGIILNKKTGLIGNVTTGKSKDGSYILTAKALLQPGLQPGRKVIVSYGKHASTECRVESVRFVGDTHGSNWYADLEMKVIS